MITPVTNPSHNQQVTDGDKVTGSKASRCHDEVQAQPTFALQPFFKQQHCHPRRAYCFFKQNCSLRAYCCSCPAGHWMATAATARSRARHHPTQSKQRSKPRGDSSLPLGGAPQEGPLRLRRGEGLTAHFKLQAVFPKLCTVQYFSAEFIDAFFQTEGDSSGACSRTLLAKYGSLAAAIALQLRSDNW